MAYIPPLQSLSETLASSYDLSSSPANFTSTDLSQYSKISIQIIGNSLSKFVTFKLFQSNDNVNFDELDDADVILQPGNNSVTLEKSVFSGKYLRLRLISSSSGTATIELLAKK